MVMEEGMDGRRPGRHRRANFWWGNSQRHSMLVVARPHQSASSALCSRCIILMVVLLVTARWCDASTVPQAREDTRVLADGFNPIPETLRLFVADQRRKGLTEHRDWIGAVQQQLEMAGKHYREDELSAFHSFLGDLLVDVRDIPAAFRQHRLAVERDARNYNAHRQLAVMCYYYAGNVPSNEVEPHGCKELSAHHWNASAELLLGATAPEDVELLTGILNDLGLVLRQLGRDEQALHAFHTAVVENPSGVNPMLNLASLLHEYNHVEQAAEFFERALALAPNSSAALVNYGNFLHAQGRPGAVQAWQQAVQIDPHQAVAWANLAVAYAEQGNLLRARETFQRASDEAHALPVDPETVGMIEIQRRVSIVPQIYMSVEEIEAARADYLASLRELTEANFTVARPDRTTGAGSLGYYVIYQGYFDKVVRELHAQVYWHLAPSLRYTAPFLRNPELQHAERRLAATPPWTIPAGGGGGGGGTADHSSDPRQPTVSYSLWKEPVEQSDTTSATSLPHKIRVGFLSAFFYHHSVGLLMQGVICNINRARFHVSVILLDQVVSDEVTRRICDSVDRCVQAGGSPTQARSVVEVLQLDVLVFGEIGMNTLSYFTAFPRLARRTALFWGHAVTSGIGLASARAAGVVPDGDPESIGGLDYFVSSELFEPLGEDAQLKYSETLYLMRHLSTRFRRPPAPETGVTRATFSLPQSGAMYLVPQTLYKLHPHFDSLIRAILTFDTSGFLVLLQGVATHNTAATMDRLHSTLPESVRERVFLVAQQPSARYLALCQLATVVLDPFPVGGGRSSFEIFSVGTPIVAHAEHTKVLQLTAAMYKVMGVDEGLVVRTDEDYVRAALAVSTNADRSLLLREQILRQNHLLYEVDEPVQEWEEFLAFAASAPRPDPLLTPKLIRARDVSVDWESRSVLRYDTRKEWLRTEYGWELWPWTSQRWKDLRAREETIPMRPGVTRSLNGRLIPDLTHPDLLFVMKMGHSDPYTFEQSVAAIEVRNDTNVDTVCNTFATETGKDLVVRHFICECLHWSTQRHTAEKLRSYHYTFQDPHFGDHRSSVPPLEVRLGDSLEAITNFHSLRHLVSNEELTMLSALPAQLRSQAEPSPDWLAVREILRAQSPSRPLPCNNGAQHNSRVLALRKWYNTAPDAASRLALSQDYSFSNATPEYVRMLRKEEHEAGQTRGVEFESVTIAITTCKRLKYFEATMDALLRYLRVSQLPDEGHIVTQVLVIDDNSSQADRVAMMKAHPRFTFVFKAQAESGHARSMNMILDLVRTRYLLYLEDDWLALPPAKDVDALRDAVVLLNASKETSEPFVQVLLNDQSSYQCRLGKRQKCDSSKLGTSGWNRTLRGIDHRRHEFASLTTAHYFSHWPGFTLNPAVWDVPMLRYLLQSCYADDVQRPSTTGMFNTSAKEFEWQATLDVYKAGGLVAYLPQLNFEHIGEDSAYELNGKKRIFDDYPQHVDPRH